MTNTRLSLDELMTNTRLSLIEDRKDRDVRAMLNNELQADTGSPIEGEEEWTKEDYQLQMDHTKEYADRMMKMVEGLSETHGLSRPRNTPN